MSFETFTRPCRQCGKDLITTSKREVVHAWCRKTYYAKMRSRPGSLKRLSVKKARSTVFVKEGPCVVCNYSLITKNKNFFNKELKKTEEYILCLRCLSEIRCGFLQPVTWKELDRE